jgi:hypothetical protein
MASRIKPLWPSTVLSALNVRDNFVAAKKDIEELQGHVGLGEGGTGGTGGNTVEGLNGVSSIWQGTQAEYDALTPDANTIYFIV